MYENGKLTRSGMESVIKSGGSVIYKGSVINTVAGLPKESDLAESTGDVDRAKDLQKKNEAEIERLKAENQRLREVRQPPAAEPPVAPPVNGPAPKK